MLNALAVIVFAALFLLLFAAAVGSQPQGPTMVVLNESEVRRILIWHHALEHECMNREDDDKLAGNLRKLFNLSADPQEYPEWDG